VHVEAADLRALSAAPQPRAARDRIATPSDFEGTMTQEQIQDFEVSVERRAGTAIVHVVGELDLATAPSLMSALHGLERPCDRVIIDLSGLQFIDSTGLRLAVEEYQRATADGFELVIAGAAENVLRVLRIAGLDVTLPLAPDVASVIGDSIDDGDRR
jgi:anti-sigma B factor antagonist